MIGKYPQLLKALLSNCVSNISGKELTYIIDGRSWVIKEIGKSITKSLSQRNQLAARISYDSIGIRNQIIHFGSVGHFFIRGGEGGWHKPHSSNQFILTWFHVAPGDPRLAYMKIAQEDLVAIHTSCNSTKKTLIESGVNPLKVHVIPLGIDLSKFHAASDEEKGSIQRSLEIPENRFVIGSFQKDGEGWGDGLEPKLVKGPDVFVDTVIQVKDLRPFVLLTGPSRGYVKKRLSENGIDFKHIYIDNFSEIPRMYNALDLYIIASRVEGGPMAILESWASGVPVVSTKVGMVPDIAVDRETALLCNVEDVVSLVSNVKKISKDKVLRTQMVKKSLEQVQEYSWDKISDRHFIELYKPLV
ncbi:MAG: glycosyltransferase family 4 protein [Parcubacteria group bacterium]|nr:glycosyltransferase family 4 protein [Parcubacteria group bacterium]